MEERRRQDERFEEFLEKFFKLQSDVQRLTEHEKLDKPRYEEWHEETTKRLVELEKMRLETTNGRLTELEKRPILLQISEEQIKKLFFGEWAEILAGRLFIKLVLSLGGALGVIGAAITAYLGFRK